jgi:hypothetical protein
MDMSSRSTTAAIVVGLALLAAIAGCGDGSEGRAAAARAREWAAMQRDKQQLDAERAELARLRGHLASVPVAADGTPAIPGDAALADEVATRQQRIAARSSSLGERLVRHLGGLRRGAAAKGPEGPEWQQAVRLKSDEDIAVAQEWIERGGDYRRAIEILETQRQLDPGYARLEQALARARDMRFVTAERFARVHEGMTPMDVRAALGPVNLRQVLRRPAERLEAWYYPKRDGGRAAVYFRYDAQRRGYVVYQTALAAGAERSASSSVIG